MILKTLKSVLIIALAYQGTWADTPHTTVDVKANSLFVPVGFDDNDEVFIVLDGYFPDACYRLVKPYVRFDYLAKQIVVGTRAKRFSSSCPDIAVPYTLEVRIGTLHEGSYTIVTKDERLQRTLKVQGSSNEGPDDYVYAPIDNAHVEYRGDQWVAVLEGRFTNSCLSIQKTMVSVTGNTIQVLPVMAIAALEDDDRPCQIIETPFKTQVVLPSLSDEGPYLLHVRSLNGQAVNEVFLRTPSGVSH